MSNNRELDILVAKELGYTVREHRFSKQIIYHNLIAPEGYGFRVRDRITEEYAWLDVPNFSTDITEAMKLVEREEVEFSLVYEKDIGTWWYNAKFDSRELGIDESAPRAIVEAWLMFQAVDFA